MPPRKPVTKAIKKKKRSHFNYTEEALAQAVHAIRNENKAIRAASRHFGVPRSTIQDRLSGRIKEQPRKVGPAPILGVDGELKVVDWIIELSKCGIPINKETLIDTVANLLKDMGKADKFPGRPGQTWYQNFLKRHPEISVREPESINKARESVRESSIRKWFSDLECFLTETGHIDIMKDPERILNADETGVSLCPKTGKVLAPKGYKNVYMVKRGNEKETITVLIMITASGKVCPPLVVFPYIRPPKAVVDNMPDRWVLGRTESGWMRSDVFYEYIANDFNNWLTDNNVKKPVILFVDGHKSHMSMPLSQFCEENGIILYALPPNTTHIMQPADVSVFRPLKQEWKRTLVNWQSKPENANKAVTKTNFCKVFEETLNVDMTQTIRNGFRKCGLFPFNVEAVDYKKCVKDYQLRRKNRSLSAGGGLTDRDFVIAHKVVLSLKENLIKKGIDVDIVFSEIEMAKSLLNESRQSKTPRKSTEVVRSSSEVLEARAVLDANNKEDYSLLDDIPDVGSLVSLNEISVIGLSDINFDDTNPNLITLNNNTTKTKYNTKSSEDNLMIEIIIDENPKKSTNNLNVEPAKPVPQPAEVYKTPSTNDLDIEPAGPVLPRVEDYKAPSLEDLDIDTADPVPLPVKYMEIPSTKDLDIEPADLVPSPAKKNEFLSTNDMNIEPGEPIPLTAQDHNSPSKKNIICENTDKLNSREKKSTKALSKPLKDFSNDAFKKHLKFPISFTDAKNKKKNMSIFPSAISSKAWRNYHEIKEKDKQNKIDEKNKRKAERELKKREPVAKKRKVGVRKTEPGTSKCKKTKEAGIEMKENNKIINNKTDLGNHNKTDKITNKTDKENKTKKNIIHKRKIVQDQRKVVGVSKVKIIKCDKKEEEEENETEVLIENEKKENIRESDDKEKPVFNEDEEVELRIF